MNDLLRPLIAFCLLLVSVPVCAETLTYRLEVPDHRRVNYELFFDVHHAGKLALHAEWSGSRVLAFRLHAPDDSWNSLGRSGPSPQHLEIDVNSSRTGLGRWKLSIRGLSSHGGGEGTITLQLPDEYAARPASPPSESVPKAAAAPWLLSRSVAVELPESWRALVDSTERFRSIVVEGSARSDSCRWQEELLRYLAMQRDLLIDRGQAPKAATRELLRDIVLALREVEALRVATDPLLAGPPPSKERAERAWLRLRRRRLEEIEFALDRALENVRRGRAPDLSGEQWPVRLVSCITACERHFEERVRLGEERAANRDLARSQWTVALAAGEALSHLARVDGSGRR